MLCNTEVQRLTNAEKLICQGPLLVDMLKYTLQADEKKDQATITGKVCPAACDWGKLSICRGLAAFLFKAILTSHSQPAWVLCVCIIKRCLAWAVWFILMLEMMLYIRHRTCHIPLISLHLFKAHTCATGICFLFGPVLLGSGKRRGNNRVRRKGRRRSGGGESDSTQPNRWTNEAKPSCPNHSKMFLSFYNLSRNIPPPCGHFGKHSSVSLLLQQMPHCECSSVFKRHPLIPTRGQSLLWLLQDRFTFCFLALLWPGKRALKLLRASVENVAMTNCLCVFVCVKRERSMQHRRARSHRWIGKEALTLVLALAELLTEILGHHTRAGAVTGMVRVITWLVVVHLIGRVIWSNRRQPSDWHNNSGGGHIVAVALRCFNSEANIPFLSWIFAHNLPH